MANKPLKTIKFPGITDIYTIPEIDSTLAISGQAADAKIVGDKIIGLNHEVTSYVEGSVINSGYNFDKNREELWEQGLINPYGVNVDNLETIRTVGYVPSDTEVIYLSTNGYEYRVAKYSSSGVFDSSSEWIGYSASPYILNSSYKYRVSIRGGQPVLSRFSILKFLKGQHNNTISQDITTSCAGMLNQNISNLLEWKRGYIDSTTGEIQSNNKVLSNNSFFTGKILNINNGNYQFALGKYDSSGNFINRIGWFYSGSYFLESDKKYRISIRRIDGADILVNEYSVIRVYDDENVISNYYNKKLSILGDSISTFQGYIPSENGSYYPDVSRVPDVTRVQDTWWYKSLTALQIELLVNNSWSGSCVCEGGTSAQSGYSRCRSLHTSTYAPDVIIIAMGVNDFLNGIQLGEYDGTQSTFPTSPTSFREGYAMTLKKMLEYYPRAEVWCATIMNCERLGDLGFPEKNTQGVPLNSYNDAIRQLANLFGCKVLDFDKCGITYQNLNIYMGDWEVTGTGQGLHPNERGHSLMANQAIRQLDNFIRIKF